MDAHASACGIEEAEGDVFPMTRSVQCFVRVCVEMAAIPTYIPRNRRILNRTVGEICLLCVLRFGNLSRNSAITILRARHPMRYFRASPELSHLSCAVCL
jgi:hypothetical protein